VRFRAVLLLFAVILASRQALAVNLQEKVREYKIPKYLIHGESYVSLKGVLKILGCEGSWGKIQDRIFFIYNNREVKMRVGSTQIIIGEKKREMAWPPKEVEGEVLVNLASFDRIIGEIDGGAIPVNVVESKLKSGTAVEEHRNSSGSGSYVILIDAGHGGKDVGAKGTYGLQEKDVNLDVSLRLRDALKKKLAGNSGVKIVMSRETDVFLSLEERVQAAKSLKADLFFCVHTNSSRYNRFDADGFETYFPRRKEEMTVLPPPKDFDGSEEETVGDSVVVQIVQDLNRTTVIDESRNLAEMVQEKLAERLICPDRGAKPANFYVLKYTPMFSVLTEIGFICNPNIEANLRDVAVRQAIGEELANAIAGYLKKVNVLP